MTQRLFTCQTAGHAGGDVMAEFTEQQKKMQEEMGDTSNPMEMFSKLMSGDLGDLDPNKPSPQQQRAAVGNGGAKRSKKQKD